jgi:hypothetical protein
MFALRGQLDVCLGGQRSPEKQECSGLIDTFPGIQCRSLFESEFVHAVLEWCAEKLAGTSHKLGRSECFVKKTCS